MAAVRGIRCRSAFWVLVAALTLAIALGGVSSAQTTLSVWGLWGSGTSYEAVRTIMDRFQAENPDVVIEYTPIRHAEYIEKVLLGHVSGTGPDVLFLADEWFESAYRAGILSPLPRDFEEEIREAFYANPLTIGEREGVLYGIPTEFNLYVLMWNQDLFDEAGIAGPPEKWEEWRLYAQRLTRRDADDRITRAGLNMYFGGGSDFTTFFANLLATNGHEGYPDDLTRINLTDPLAIETLEFVQELYLQHRVWEPGAPGYATGNLAMTITHYGDSGNLRRNVPALFESSHIATIPRNRGDHANLFWGWAITVPLSAKHPDEAWRFVRYFTNSENTGYFADTKGHIITRRDTFHTFRDHWIDQEPTLVQYATAHAAWHPAWDHVYDIAGPLLLKATQGEISAVEALANITDQVRAVALEAEGR